MKSILLPLALCAALAGCAYPYYGYAPYGYPGNVVQAGTTSTVTETADGSPPSGQQYPAPVYT